MNKVLFSDKARLFLKSQDLEDNTAKPNIGGAYKVNDNCYVAFDTTDGEVFVEEFQSYLEASVYAFGIPAYFGNNVLSC